MSSRCRSVRPTSSRPSSSRHRVYSSISNDTVVPAYRTSRATRSTVTSVAGSASIAVHSASTSACGRSTVSRPDLVELFLKMSANRELMTTRKPPSSSAQTACSREEPVPKSGPATRTEASAYCGWLSTKSGSLVRQATNRPSSKPVRVIRLRYSAGMIWSVSTLVRRSGAAVPVWVVKASIGLRLPSGWWGGWSHGLEVGGGGEVAGQRRRGGDGRGHQVRPAALALPALEIAVARRRRALARLELVGVHAQAHRAPGAAPLGAGVDEHPVEALGLGLHLDPHRAGDDEHAGVRVDPLSTQQLGGDPQVLDPAVGARAEEDRVHLDLAQRRAGGQPHVGQRLLGGAPVVLVGDVGGIGHPLGDRQGPAGGGGPGGGGGQGRRGRADPGGGDGGLRRGERL